LTIFAGPAERKAPVKKQKVSPVFTKKENATLTQQIKILDWHHKNGKSQAETAAHFVNIYPNLQIKQPLVSSWLKNEKKWRGEWEVNGC
jgi:hypothetical protein